MKKGIFLFLAAFLIFSSFSSINVSAELVGASTPQNLLIPQVEQIIKDNNQLIYTNIKGIIQEEIKVCTSSQEANKKIISDTLREERIKTMLGVFSSCLLALIIYSFIRFKLRIKENDILKNATNRK